jgi:hypothetical protein
MVFKDTNPYNGVVNDSRIVERYTVLSGKLTTSLQRIILIVQLNSVHELLDYDVKGITVFGIVCNSRPIATA